VNLDGVARLPAAPSSAVRATVPIGTSLFWLSGEIEHGESTMLPVKVMAPPSAKAAWDNRPATATANNLAIVICFIFTLRNKVYVRFTLMNCQHGETHSMGKSSQKYIHDNV
jgi:hypothetical protein